MRSRFLTEDDLRHFTRNGARVRGGSDGAVGRFGVIGESHSLPQKSVARSSRQPESSPAPSPSRRYEYQGQVYKSKTEVRYAMHLEALKFGKDILDWRYEPFNIRLPGKKNYYKVDWLVWRVSGVTLIDTKGWNLSDDRSLVKIKTAAGLNRWATFKQVRWIKGAWIERVIEVN